MLKVKYGDTYFKVTIKLEHETVEKAYSTIKAQIHDL